MHYGQGNNNPFLLAPLCGAVMRGASPALVDFRGEPRWKRVRAVNLPPYFVSEFYFVPNDELLARFFANA